MDKVILKKILLNNAMFFLIDLLILGLIVLGVFDSIFSSFAPGVPFYIPIAPILLWRILVLVPSILIAYNRYGDNKLDLKKLTKYYAFSFISQIIVTSVIFSMFPAFSSFLVIFLTIMVFISVSVSISFMIVNLQKRNFPKNKNR